MDAPLIILTTETRSCEYLIGDSQIQANKDPQIGDVSRLQPINTPNIPYPNICAHSIIQKHRQTQRYAIGHQRMAHGASER